MTAIPITELNRIKLSIPDAKSGLSNSKSASVRERSNLRILAWTDTKEGELKERLIRRQKRLQEAEEERRRIDIEEANYQLQARKEIVLRANRLLYVLNPC